MTINWYGQTCFKITAAIGRGEQVNMIIDPPTKDSGLRGPKLEADIFLVTDPEQKVSEGNFFLINMPGEYDVKEVSVRGVNAHGGAIYIVEAEEMRICHLGKIHQPELTSEQLESIGDIDILILPVGGGKSLDATMAAKIMSQVEPKVIIPMYYHIPSSSEKLDKLESFLKVIGVEKADKLEKLSIKKKDLPTEEEAKVIVLEA